MPGEYRCLHTFVYKGQPEARHRLVLDEPEAGNRYVVYETRAGHLRLGLFWHAADGDLVLSARLGDAWETLARWPHRRGPLVVDLDIEPDGLFLTSGDHTLRLPLEAGRFGRLQRVMGNGGWRLHARAGVSTFPAAIRPVEDPDDPRLAAFAGAAGPVVVDAGAYNGQDTEHYLACGERVLAIEANAGLAARLAHAFAADIREARLLVLNMAVGEREGRSLFYSNAASEEWSSLNAGLAARRQGGRVTTVTEITLSRLLARFDRVSFLKLDIEGLDYRALADLAMAGVRPDFLSLELAAQGQKVTKVLQAAARLGYTHFALIDQGGVPAMERPRRAQDAGLPALFEAGSSGPHGPDIPAGWVSAEEVAAHDFAATPPETWYDLHMTTG